jgi:hypothetical protein
VPPGDCLVETVGQCNSEQVAGFDTPESREIELGATSGSFLFSYDAQTIPDRFIVTYEGAVLFDSQCVSGAADVPIDYSGRSTRITVRVEPNCAGDMGTSWTFVVGCPVS